MHAGRVVIVKDRISKIDFFCCHNRLPLKSALNIGIVAWYVNLIISAQNPAFKWVNTTLGNIKSAITGTYRAIRDKHVPRYLAEFEYRFNRRYDLAAMMPRLGYVAVRTPPMPYRLLKLAEDHA